jgi:SAM-dependent methyltransferase
MRRLLVNASGVKVNVIKKTCPICDSDDVDNFLEIPKVPAYCNLLWPTRDEAIKTPTGDIRLGFCRYCGHIYNYLFNPDILDYTQDYENTLHCSPLFQKYARSLARGLIEKHGLYDKEIIDIGCGAGDFLKLLCEIGGNRGLGFDPSRTIDRSVSSVNDEINFISDFYSERYSNYKADAICCRHVLEHIQFPLQFLQMVHQAVRDRHRTLVFFEVPNVMFTMKDLGIWDLIYEHPSYFSNSSLAVAFSSSGFKVHRLYEAFEGQFLCLEAFPAKELDYFPDYNPVDIDRLFFYVSKFAEKYRSKLETWHNKLDQIAHDKKRAVLWGAGSKGVTFLNALKASDQLDYVIDINPQKQEKYMAGTGQRIMQPKFLLEYKPDIVIVMNPIYYSEIERFIDNMNFSVEIVIA